MIQVAVEPYIAGSYMVCLVKPDGSWSTRDEKNTILYQTDWDYPSLANNLGHVVCPHGTSDGTVACKECGKTATDFITEACNFLDELCGVVLEVGEGYFGGLWPVGSEYLETQLYKRD